MQRVPIPSVRQDERIGSSFNHIIQVVDLTERASSDTVVWDFSGISFLHPFFLAPLAIYRQQSRREIRCENISLEMQSYLNNIYFDRMLHFENAPKEAAEHVMEHYANVSRVFHWHGTIILLRIPVNAPQGFSYIDYLE